MCSNKKIRSLVYEIVKSSVFCRDVKLTFQIQKICYTFGDNVVRGSSLHHRTRFLGRRWVSTTRSITLVGNHDSKNDGWMGYKTTY